MVYFNRWKKLRHGAKPPSWSGDRGEGFVEATNQPLEELEELRAWEVGHPVGDLCREITDYGPVESIIGALTLLCMDEEFPRDELELYRKRPGPRVCDMPAVHARSILEALARRVTA